MIIRYGFEGARRINADPSRSVVVEDAIAGVEAGRDGLFGLVLASITADNPRRAKHGVNAVQW